jgi:hypothetical protein
LPEAFTEPKANIRPSRGDRLITLAIIDVILLLVSEIETPYIKAIPNRVHIIQSLKNLSFIMSIV